MNNAEFRQARQSDPRKGAAGDHDAISDPGELAISGFKNGIGDERWQFDHPFAHPAQAGSGGHDQGSARSAADELFVDSERADGVSRLFEGTGADRKNWKDLKSFVDLLCVTKLGAFPGPRDRGTKTAASSLTSDHENTLS